AARPRGDGGPAAPAAAKVGPTGTEAYPRPDPEDFRVHEQATRGGPGSEQAGRGGARTEVRSAAEREQAVPGQHPHAGTAQTPRTDLDAAYRPHAPDAAGDRPGAQTDRRPGTEVQADAEGGPQRPRGNPFRQEPRGKTREDCQAARGNPQQNQG